MLTTNAARETHKHLNIRLTRRTIASENIRLVRLV